jgi:hypothetical protein
MDIIISIKKSFRNNSFLILVGGCYFHVSLVRCWPHTRDRL